ncbi:MAG: DEAD/DEAH box helicase [Actinomycetes bacterium]
MPAAPHRPRTPTRTSASGTSVRTSPRRPARARAPRPAAAAPPRSPLDLAIDAALATPAPAPATFAELGLAPRLVEALARTGVHEPFAIQSRALPDALAGRDVLGRAETGSGKTLAFGLALLTRLALGTDRPARPRNGAATRGQSTPGALVLVPTRELAVQVAAVLAPLGVALGLRTTAVFGGAGIGRQMDILARGVDVVVATPGRLIDLIERGAVTLGQVRVTVLDEADYMADLGFLPAVTRLLDQTPPDGQRLLFSATLDRGVDRLVRAYLHEPAVHAVAHAPLDPSVMDHQVFAVRNEEKVPVTAEVVARPGRTLVFVRTKHGADRLATQLRRAGVEAAALHGNLKQSQRQRALDGFADGSPRVLVATDVAARGIHVDDVDLVVHFDPPADHKDYLHRSGRTARAGASGTVLALVGPDQVREVSRLHEAAGVQATITKVEPGDPAVRTIATSGTPVVPRPRASAPPVVDRGPRNGGAGRPRRPGPRSAVRRPR